MIRNRGWAKQLRDFSGLRFGSITPTDIDGYLEFNDRLFIWIELKFAGAPLWRGQRLALARMCDVIHGTKNARGERRIAAILVVEHMAPPDQDVDVAQANVCEVRYDGVWKEPSKPIACRKAIEYLLRQAGMDWRIDARCK